MPWRTSFGKNLAPIDLTKVRVLAARWGRWSHFQRQIQTAELWDRFCWRKSRFWLLFPAYAMKNYALPAVIGLLLALQGAVHGALVWESTEADLHPSLSDKTAVGHFKYKNTGDKPVKITSVHPSCGCTTAALAKDVVGPNEGGEITATFHIGDRSGVQQKTITVTTDDTTAKPTILKLVATIPQLLQVHPVFVYWSANDALDPKTITVTVDPEFPVTKLMVTSTDKSIATQVKPGPGEKTFSIIVTPTESGRPINAALKIEPDYPKEAPRPFYANLRVDSRAKPAATK
jgi:hypothetical protein